MNPPQKQEKIKLVEINSCLTCYLCKGYLIDATTISECLHSFCRSCVIKFLQENSYCPVCKVTINKAKPCLKLDKTLQDIVYKLVPELFQTEMQRRRCFYQERPALAAEVSPEERGEDTERTIFNPQDAISLSLEYISDDSTPGAIPVLATPKNGCQSSVEETSQDNPMKRFLQCPAMCRIDVLKKFVVNKYNVDTNLFHIDVLYKRVPLPDHYTLIDIGYIYSWKRNEPMKFFFRITDINKVTERFDYFDSRHSQPVVVAAPPRPSTSSSLKNGHHHHRAAIEKTPNNKKKSEAATVAKSKESVVVINTQPTSDQQVTTVATPASSPTLKQIKMELEMMKRNNRISDVAVTGESSSSSSGVKDDVVKCKNENVLMLKSDYTDKTVKKSPANCSDLVKKPLVMLDNKKSDFVLKSEITEEIKSKIQSSKSDIKNSVYTNITLNRDDNVEIITKVQKVSNKLGHPIGLNIINHTVKKTTNNKVQNTKTNNPSSSSPPSNNGHPSTSTNQVKPNENVKTEENKDQQQEEDIEKSNFLKSIELTAKSSLIATTPSTSKSTKTSPIISKTTKTSPSKSPTTTAQKRKSTSPLKNNEQPSSKRAKIEKKPVKIIIQPKTIANPTVRQMVSNVNQNVNNMSKIVEQTTITSPKTADIQSLIDNCKINIPSSLSITLNEGGDGGARTPPSIPPVKNFIEILKLPDSNNKQQKDNGIISDKKVNNDLINNKVTDKSPIHQTKNSSNNVNIQTFQRIFEESITKKSTPEFGVANNNNKSALDLTVVDSVASATNGKRKVLDEIATQLHQKKTKLFNNNKEDPVKIAIPRLMTQQRKSAVPTSANKFPYRPSALQTSAAMHSPSLGLNYTVSVGDGKTSPASSSSSSDSGSGGKRASKSPAASPKMTSTQLLEKYNIQNLAQLTASFNFNGGGSGGGSGSGQMGAALQQHALLFKQHLDRQTWLNNHGSSLMNYEKYLQSLNNNAQPKKVLGNIKEN